MSQVDNKLLNFFAIRAKSVSNGVLSSNLRFLENIVKECDNVTKDLKYYLKKVEKSHNSHMSQVDNKLKFLSNQSKVSIEWCIR